MEIVIALAIVCATVFVVNRQGWYTLSEYIALFGAGWIARALVEMVI